MTIEFSKLHDARTALAEAFAETESAAVLTGAGLSTESGLPDFRSPGGIWSRMQPIEFDDFLVSEEARLEDWRRRFQMAELFAAAEPNAAHHVLADLAHAGKVACIVTQNIDGLHTRAGTPAERLVEIHGTAGHAHCLTCGARVEIEDAKAQIEARGTAPRCEVCGGLVKAAVVSFGEAMPIEAMRRAEDAASGADVFVAAGTSLAVYPAAALPMIAREAGALLIIASRAPTELDDYADLIIRTPLAETFAALRKKTFH